MQQEAILFSNEKFYIEIENAEIPWLKIFPKEPFLELTDMPKELREELWHIYYTIEHEMRHYYRPTKINMASFANILPRVHIHVMARFENDSYFPNPMWGEKMREGKLDLPDKNQFYKNLLEKLNKI
jgi:diadenosine tetraphosphate (Ap4A) HIT family hydrolase